MIEIKGLCKSYDGKKIFSHLDLVINEQETSAITGASGCGKTTLLRIIAGLEPYEAGSISGVEDKRISYVFQEDRLMPWLNVRENIEYVLASTEDNKKIQYKIKTLLEAFKLEEYGEAMIRELSGGMQRRVAIARALAYDSQLLLLDEPFKGLDEELKWHVFQSMQQYLNLNPRTVICVTHDLEIAKSMAYQIDMNQLTEIK